MPDTLAARSSVLQIRLIRRRGGGAWPSEELVRQACCPGVALTLLRPVSKASTRAVIETASDGKMDEQLGFDSHHPADRHSSSSCNESCGGPTENKKLEAIPSGVY